MPARVHRWLGVAGAIGAAAIAASPADAMTIRVGDPALIGRVALRVPVVVSCTPFEPSYTLVFTGASVSVQQASGKDIASGSGFLSGGVFGMGQSAPLFACDGSEHDVTVPVSANAAGPPFHGGHAVVNVSASVSAGQPCFPGSTTCFFNSIGQSASIGPVEVHL